MKERLQITLCLLFLGTVLTWGQNTITGTVISEDAEPLIGLTVIEVGTDNGTVTDLDGSYEITVGDGASLQFSYTGYQTQTVDVGTQTSIDLVMVLGVALDEIVVTGYGSQKKKDLTGSIVKVTEKEFVQGVNSNALQLLNGKASGVQISQVDSRPGGALDIKIRGANSINSSNDVLIVIDGLPGGSVTALSPDDIESIEVLKDASASAIYGSRAANGVVLITTKKGRKGEPTFNYTSYVAFQDVKDRVDMLNGSEYLTVLNDINVESGGDIIHPPEKIAAVGEGYDWQDLLFRNAITHNHQLSLSGGSDKSTYYVALNYFDQEGVMIQSGQDKFNIRINYEVTPTDKLKFGVNLNANRSLTQRISAGRGTNEGAGALTAALLFDPTIGPERNADGLYDRNPLVAIENPMAEALGVDDRERQTVTYTSAFAEYEIIKGLKATVRLGAEMDNFRRDIYENGLTERGRGLNGEAAIITNEDTYWIAEYLASYEFNLGDDHALKLLGGITYENFEQLNVRTDADDFLSHVTGTNLLQSGNPETYGVQSGKFINRLNSQLGRINYAYKDKYLFTASIRRDGTSRFSTKNKYATFPSASIGWKISEEDFMSGQNIFNDLKLRLGYGEIGNQGINNFETIQTFRAGSNAVLGGTLQNGAVPARIPNEDLVWETTKEFNIGIDYAILDFRISGSIDYFSRNTFDQLFRQPVPFTTGFNDVRVNLGQVRNSGFDFSIRTRNIVGKFNWETDLIFSLLENEVIELPEFAQRIVFGGFGFSGNYLITQEGFPMSSFYGFKINGIFQENDDIANSAQPNALPGHPIFNDTDGNGQIDANDKIILGDPFPDLTFGLTNTFSYGNFGLQIYIQGVQGVETFNNLVAESLYPINKERNHIAQNYLDRWRVSNPDAEFPSGVNYTAYSDGENKVNTFTIQDASFIRLRNITFNYQLPLQPTAAIKGLNLYISGENLLTISDYDGFDPDGNSDGVGTSRATFSDYPIARTIRIGAKVDF